MTEYGKTFTITISSNTNSINNTAMVIDFKLKLPLNTSYEWKIDIPRPPTSYVDENFIKSYNYIMELIKNYTPKASLERHYKNKLYIPLALILLEDKEKKSGTRYLLVYFPSKDPCSFSKIHVELCKQANNVYNLVRQTKEMKCLEWETVYNTSMKISFFRNSNVHKTKLFKLSIDNDINRQWLEEDGQDIDISCISKQKRQKKHFLTMPTQKSAEFMADFSIKTIGKKRNLEPNVLCNNTTEAFKEIKKRTLLSCYHTIKTNENFQNVISAKQLVDAIKSLKDTLQNQHDKLKVESAIDAAANLFYEDVSWRLGEVNPVPSKFKNSSYDIDQVIIYITIIHNYY